MLGVLMCAPGPAAAQERLEHAGVKLSTVVVTNVRAAVVDKQIMLDGDIAEASHVVVQFAGGGVLMRDRSGLFQPWDREPAHLPDNGFPAVSGALHFKVLDQDLSGVNFPLRVTVYYRAGGRLKYGYFDVLRGN